MGEVPGAALPAELTRHIGYTLRRVFVLLGSDAAGADEAATRDFVLLDALADGDSLSQHDLAERLGINRTVMVQLIDRLEGDGRVTRTRNPRNRRSYVLSLTDSGRRALEELRRSVAERDARLTAPLSEPERERFDLLLGRLLPAQAQPIPRSTSYLVTQAHYRLRKVGDDKLAGTGLRLRHFGPLSTINVHSSCAQRQLAEHLAITEPAAAQVVDELVRAGLVRRGRDPRDRRRYALELTDRGRESLKTVERAVEDLQSDIEEMLGPGGETELKNFLFKILEYANATADVR
ncbi:MarR family transcriptional regulator [Streptomyces sp. TRM43335]|uniref:MarR family transcriptional regulator n=2 Tax=Streptomyces taklimakanensis TaxID=2569853 RepID=A0A6G2BGH1_9ACTN|nr:MarR family transcriptional regulator [Streptomyces taklimakanensis]